MKEKSVTKVDSILIALKNNRLISIIIVVAIIIIAFAQLTDSINRITNFFFPLRESREPGIYLKTDALKGAKLTKNNLIVVKKQELGKELYSDRPQNLNSIIKMCLERNVSSNRYLTWDDIASKCD